MRRAGLLLLLVAGVAARLLWGPAPPAPRQPSLSVTDVLAASDADRGFARADHRHTFAFPADHGAHADFRSEWWYFTGNLASPSGRPFGFQLTLFRFALSPADTPSASAWRTRQIVLGHFAVSDIDGGRFLADERMSRAAIGLAGTLRDPPSVWIDDWRIELADPANGGWRLSAAGADSRIELALRARRPITLQGEAGLSRKSAAPGNASYYYSVSRLEASGTLTVAQQAFAVTGSAWLDREWSTSALGREQVGWDWFALQLDDDTELMFYRLRRTDGAIDPHSGGVFVAPDGAATTLAAEDVVIRDEATWTSPATGRRYPARWTVSVPRYDLELTVTPRLADQEWRGMIAYWEGSVAVAGRRRAVPVTGLGYVELTGY